MNLLKNLHCGRNAKRDKWDIFLIKFISRYSLEDSLNLEKNGYLSCDIDFRLRSIKVYFILNIFLFLNNLTYFNIKIFNRIY